MHRFYEMFATLYGMDHVYILCNCIASQKSHHYYAIFTSSLHVYVRVNYCKQVRDWGPQWGYSYFSFESMNGHLKNHFHGTRSMNAHFGIFTYMYTCTCAPMAESLHVCIHKTYMYTCIRIMNIHKSTHVSLLP